MTTLNVNKDAKNNGAETNEDAESSGSEENPYSMTEEVLRNRLNKKHYGRVSTQLYAGVIGAVSAVAVGTSLGWSRPYFEQMENDLDSDTAWIVSAVAFGMSMGVVPASYAWKKIGPRKTLIVMAPVSIISWLLMSFIPGWKMTIACRFFLGVSCSFCILCGDVLLVRSVNENMQFLHAICFSSILLGVLIVHFASHYLSIFWLNIYCSTLPIIHLVLLLIAPESPVYLFRYGEGKAEKALRWYQGDKNIGTEMKRLKIIYQLSRQDAELKSVFYSKVVLKAIGIIIGLNILKIATGYYVFLFYNIYYWRDKLKYPVYGESILLSVVLCVSKYFWVFIHTKYSLSVKKTLTASCALTAILHLIVCTYFYLFYNGYHIPDTIDSLVILVFPLMVFTIDLGFAYIPRVLFNDYIPAEVWREAYMAIETSKWMLIFIVLKCFISMSSSVPTIYGYAICAFISFMGIFYSQYIVVETKDMTFINIQLAIGGNPTGTRSRLGGIFTRPRVN